MEKQQILLVISGIGAVQSFFFGLYFSSLGWRGINKVANILLGLMLFMVAIRTAKSTIYLYGDLSILYMNFGFAAHAATGPLLLLYLLTYVRQAAKFFLWDLIHFIPTFSILIFSSTLTETNFWFFGGYTTLVLQGLVYVVISTVLLILKFKNFTNNRVWFVSLVITIGVLLGAYFSNYMLAMIPYRSAPLVYSGFIYFTSFLILKKLDFFKKENTESIKYKYLKLSHEDIDRYNASITASIQKDQPYLQRDFSLKTLSGLTGIPSYILSYIFNEVMKKKFNDYVNEFRIISAKKRLIDQEYSHMKISAIATDCGFNSLSSFNNAFKKFTGKTPSTFKDEHQSLTDL